MKATKSSYQYVVLRYVHDISAGEFVNCGIVLLAPGLGYVGAKFKTTYSRIKKTFPTLDGDGFRAHMRKLQTAFDRVAEKDLAGLARESTNAPSNLLNVVHSVVRSDDSSLQWSPIGSGLTSAPQETLKRLYQRFVAKYDEDASAVHRKDDDVWKCFKSELEKRNVLPHLEEKVIAVEDDSVKFAHAWKNGAWHCYEPLSFDLASDASIKEKAHRWLGQVSSVQGSRERFHVYFLVGKPSDDQLTDAYQQAVSILRKTPLGAVIEEAEAARFSERVAAQMEEHGAAARLDVRRH